MQRILKKYFFVFTLPTLIAFAIAFVIPFVYGIYLSFCSFTTVTDTKWVWFDNYIKAFSNNKEFLNALWFTAKFAIVALVSINVFAFLLSLALTRKIKGTNIFRTVFFMPNLIGGIVLGYIWQCIINGVLSNFDLNLLSDSKYGFWGLIILMNWQMVGYMMVIYIAALQNVPTDLIDAAKVDGASATQRLRYITIPMVMPSITICTFLTLSNSFKLFDQNLALTGGGPAKQTQMLALDIYNTFYGRNGFEGVGQAKAVMFFVLVAVIAFAQLRFTRSKEVES
ncbi:MAG: sugar ABC transporter permease [bacterium]|nr:sugar ABC transporter permease [bacterium]